MEKLTFGSEEHIAKYGEIKVNAEGQSIISVKGILNDLKNGMSRFPTGKTYTPEIGSISEKYNISSDDIKELFSHPSLKGKKTQVKKKINFVLTEDIAPVEEVAETNGLEAVGTNEEENQEVPAWM